MGLVAGFIINQAVKFWKIPDALIAVVAAVVLGVALYIALHYGQYLTFLQEARTEIAQEWGISNGADANELIDMLLLEETGTSGFRGYMLLQVDAGFSVGRTTGSSSLPISGPIIWAYWFIEFALIAGIALVAGAGAASKTFCKTCQEWYSTQHLGSVRYESAQQFLEAVQHNDFQQAHDMVQTETAPTPSLEVYLRRCPSCDSSELHLAVEAASVDSRGRPTTREVLDRVISPDQLSALTPRAV
jgi:hypothetical protein